MILDGNNKDDFQNEGVRERINIKYVIPQVGWQWEDKHCRRHPLLLFTYVFAPIRFIPLTSCPSIVISA